MKQLLFSKALIQTLLVLLFIGMFSPMAQSQIGEVTGGDIGIDTTLGDPDNPFPPTPPDPPSPPSPPSPPDITANVYINPSFSPECIFTVYNDKGDSVSDNNECLLACKGNMVSYEAVCNNAVRYRWTVLGSETYTIADSGRSVTVVWGNGSEGLLKVEVLTSDSIWCSAETCVSLIASPEVNSTSIPMYVRENNSDIKYINLCMGETLDIIDESISDNSVIVASLWLVNGVLVSTSKDFSYTPVDTTQQQLDIVHKVINECGCYGTEMYKVTLIPSNPLELNCYGTVCSGSEQIYKVHSPICSHYHWMVEGGTIVDTLAEAITIQWGNPTSGYGVLSIDGSYCNGGCPILISKKIPIIGDQVEISGSDTVCVGETSVYELPLWGSTDYTWTITPNQQVTPMEQTNRYVATFNQVGTYYLSATYKCPFIDCGPYTSSIKRIVVKEKLSIVSDDAVVCKKALVTYTTSHNGKVLWRVYDKQNGLLYSKFTDTLYYDFAEAGDYKVTAYHKNYCEVAYLGVEVRELPPMVDTTYGYHTTCLNSGIPVWSTPTDPMYYLSWVVVGTTDTIQADSVTVMYGNTVSDIHVYQVDKELGCISDAYVHQVEEFELEPLLVDTLYGCPGELIEISAPDQTEMSTYKWKIEPSSVASIQSTQFTPTIWSRMNHNDNLVPPYAANVVLERKYCGDIEQYDTIRLVVNGAPSEQPTISKSADTICQNEILTLTADGVSSDNAAYIWEMDEICKVGKIVNFVCTDEGYHEITLTYQPQGYCTNVQVTSFVYVKKSPSGYIEDHGTYYSVHCDEPCTYRWFIDDQAQGAGSSISKTVDGEYCCEITRELAPHCSSMIYVSEMSSDGFGCESIRLQKEEVCSNIFTLSLEHPIAYDEIQWLCSSSNAHFATIDSNTTTVTFSEPGAYTIRCNVRQGNHCYTGSIRLVVNYVPHITVQYNCESGVVVTDNSKYRIGYSRPIRYIYKEGTPNAIRTIPSSEYSVILSSSQFTINTPTTISMQFGNDSSCRVSCEFTLHPNSVIDTMEVPRRICINTPLTLHAHATDVVNYRWDFGDGSHNFGATIDHAYDKNKSYTVKLTVTNANGCETTRQSELTVCGSDLSGSIGLLDSVLRCEGNSRRITYSNNIAGQYHWMPMDINRVNVNTMTIYTTDLYEVMVTETGCGCQDHAKRIIPFYPLPKAQILGATDYCLGEEVLLIGNTGNKNSYYWNMTHNGNVVVLPANNQANLKFTPTDTGMYAATLLVTSENSCNNNVNFNFYVHPQPAAPSIAYGTNRCIHTPPVDMTSATGQLLFWSNGEYDSVAQYYSAGYLSAYYMDTLTGCASKKADFYIPLAPNYDGLLTGCYRRCKSDLPINLSTQYVYPDKNWNIMWDWYWDDTILNSGQSPLTTVPITKFGTYYMDIAYNPLCNSQSPTITIEETKKCQCEDMQIRVERNFVNDVKCPFKYVLEFMIFNQGSGRMTISDVMVTDVDNYNRHNIPVVIPSGDSALVTLDLFIENFQTNVVEVSFYDSENNCYKSIKVTLDYGKIPPNCSFEVAKIYLENGINASDVGYFNFYAEGASTVDSILCVWSEPAQFIVSGIDHNVIKGLYMVNMIQLQDMANKNESICFHAIICSNGEICHIKHCVSAKELLDLVYQHRALPYIDNEEGEMMDVSEQLPKLHPNPAQDVVAIGNVEKDEIDRVILFDMEGRKVMEEVGSDQFSVTHLSQGAYIVALFMKNNEVHYMKLIKQ